MQEIISFILSVISMLSIFSGYNPKNTDHTLPIVMYHHISEKQSLLNSYVLTPEEFESDLKYLKDSGYTSVTPSELRNGNIPDKPVMITFDDGFLSVYKYALPLLQKYDMKATVAVIGSLVKEYTDTPNTVSDCAYMDRDTVKALSDSGSFEIACHTYAMHDLSPRKGCAKMKGESLDDYKTALTSDLEKFRNELFGNTGIDTSVLAIPYGAYTSDTVDIAVQDGFDIIFTSNEQVNTLPCEISFPLILGRFNRPHGISSESFFNKWK